jgi:hypothetical protein
VAFKWNVPKIPTVENYQVERSRGNRSKGKKRPYTGDTKARRRAIRKRSMKWPNSVPSVGNSAGWGGGTYNGRVTTQAGSKRG